LDLCFNKDLLEILDPEDIIKIELILCGDESSESFLHSKAYEQLFEVYMEEMPYGIAKCRSGEPDLWILDRLRAIKSRGGSLDGN